MAAERSLDGSPDNNSMTRPGNSQIVGGNQLPFPNTIAQPQFTNLMSAKGGSTKVTIRAPDKPKPRPIVKGTQEANESFERMKRSLASFPCKWFSLGL